MGSVVLKKHLGCKTIFAILGVSAGALILLMLGVFAFGYRFFFPEDQGRVLAEFPKPLQFGAPSKLEFLGVHQFNGQSFASEFKNSELYIDEISYRDLPVAEALHVKAVPQISLKYSFSDLFPFLAPLDPFYFASRKDALSLVENWESRVGISLTETQFNAKVPFAIDLSAKNRAYFGLLHSHTGESDGVKTPTDAFKTARDVARLDFFAVTDHPEYWHFRDANARTSGWNSLQSVARQMSTPQFLAVAGFEYSNSALGHYIVLNTPQAVSSFSLPGLGQFQSWLAQPDQHDAVVFFAHPGFHTYRKPLDFLHFKYASKMATQVVGIEVMHHNVFSSFLRGYNKKIPYIDEAIAKGWTLGSLASQDNHRDNWGIQDSSRLAVLMPELSQKNLFSSLRARHFYATQNENLQLSTNARLTNGTWMQMGDEVDSSLLPGGDLSVVVRYAEPDSKAALQKFEVVVNGKVAGMLRFFEPLQDSSARTLWHFDTNPVPRFSEAENTPPQAGEFRFAVPLSKFQPQRAQRGQPGGRVSVYVRLYQGEKGRVVTQSSPFYVNFNE